jgi:hypothetical protein
VTLVSEEMRRNLAHCAYEHSHWLQLAATQVDHRLTTDAAQVEGRTAYALERARDEVLRAEQLVAKWQPLYDELQNDVLARLLLVNPGFNTLATMQAHDDEARTAAHARTDKTQALVMELAEGLAMATLDCDYDVR